MQTVRIGAGQGFYGDSTAGAVAVAKRGDVQYICCDALAELTMAILARDHAKDPGRGYARDLPNFLRRLLPVCAEKKTRLITNAGGINPSAAAQAALQIGEELGFKNLKVAAVSGDDLTPRLDELLQITSLRHNDTNEDFAAVRQRAIFAVAYLGCEPIVRALEQGADIVITGRVADASLFVAPMVHELGWQMDDWDRLASGVVLGHLMECSGQATGGNFGGRWQEIPGMDAIGYPVCEMREDGEAVLTKPEGTGGRVTFDTVKQQLLYEVMDPSRYLNPDVVADFGSVTLKEIAKDRVAVSGVRGMPRPDNLKVICGYFNGWLGTASLAYAWPDAAQKARRAYELILQMARTAGITARETHVEFFGIDSAHGSVAPVPDDPNEIAVRVAGRFDNEADAKGFSRIATPLALNGPPFICASGAPESPRPLLGVWPTLVPRDVVRPETTLFTTDGKTA